LHISLPNNFACKLYGFPGCVLSGMAPKNQPKALASAKGKRKTSEAAPAPRPYDEHNSSVRNIRTGIGNYAAGSFGMTSSSKSQVKGNIVILLQSFNRENGRNW